MFRTRRSKLSTETNTNFLNCHRRVLSSSPWMCGKSTSADMWQTYLWESSHSGKPDQRNSCHVSKLQHYISRATLRLYIRALLEMTHNEHASENLNVVYFIKQFRAPLTPLTSQEGQNSQPEFLTNTLQSRHPRWSFLYCRVLLLSCQGVGEPVQSFVWCLTHSAFLRVYQNSLLLICFNHEQVGMYTSAWGEVADSKQEVWYCCWLHAEHTTLYRTSPDTSTTTEVLFDSDPCVFSIYQLPSVGQLLMFFVRPFRLVIHTTSHKHSQICPSVVFTKLGTQITRSLCV